MSEEFLRLVVMTFGAVMGTMTILWAISIALRDSSIADIFWGTGLTAIAWFAAAFSAGIDSRRTLLLVLVSLWGLRLTAYILWRNWGKEDPRYARFREHVESQGRNFAWHSLKHVYWLQGALMWVVGLVLVFIVSAATPAQIGLLGWSGVAAWMIGMIFETVGDLQLARFRADFANANRVMDQGLWRYTRHPNYFGEMCVWLGFWLLALESPWGWITVVSPVVVMYALLGPTGKTLLERRMRRKRPEFDAYVRRTSGFFPLPPRQS